MKAPSINISFIEKGVSAIERSERGIVMLWVKDPVPEKATNPVNIITESDIPEGFSVQTAEQIKLAMLGYINAPKKILVYCMGTKEETAEGESGTDAGYEAAMEAAETMRFDYLAVPTAETDGKAEDVAAWVKTMRTDKRKKIKAVLPNVRADNEGVINFTTEKMVKTETVTDKEGNKSTIDTVYTAEQYCARIAGLIAGTPMTISCTYAPLNELSDCTRLTDIDTPVDKGELILFYDGEKVKVVMGVNSFVTTIQGKGESFKKIKIVEAMDMIHDDITRTAQDSYLGKYANNYSNKCLLLSAISSYFARLKADGIISSYSVNLDAQAIRTYLKGRGLQAVLDDGGDGVVKDVDECTDGEIITADTGNNVFLTGTTKILDAIENIVMPVYI